MEIITMDLANALSPGLLSTVISFFNLKFQNRSNVSKPYTADATISWVHFQEKYQTEQEISQCFYE